jgi:hypothetical protein
VIRTACVQYLSRITLLVTLGKTLNTSIALKLRFLVQHDACIHFAASKVVQDLLLVTILMCFSLHEKIDK